MNFDWQRFCEERSVPFVTEGANVAKGNINITCPFCDDPSEHMGLSLKRRLPSWGCWRCKRAGGSPSFLVAHLLHVSIAEAKRLVQEQDSGTPDDFDNLFNEVAVRSTSLAVTRPVMMPMGVRSLSKAVSNPTLSRPYINYLARDIKDHGRGFGFREALELVVVYDLHYAVIGECAGRIILPVYHEFELVSWVGRAIAPAMLRYKTPDGGTIKKHVAHYDVLWEAADDYHALAITEGPFDFLKLDYFGQQYGLRATCTFGTSYGQEQVARLRELALRFKRTFVLFDQGAAREGMMLAEELSELTGKRISSLTLPSRIKDPGDMTPKDIRIFCSRSVGL